MSKHLTQLTTGLQRLDILLNLPLLDPKDLCSLEQSLLMHSYQPTCAEPDLTKYY